MAQDLSDFENDPRLFLFTSLTAGSSHIITATSRLETILKANKIPFQAIDTATDEKARRLWQRRGAKKKLPGLVKDGFVIGDLEEIEEWNEFGELKENIGSVPANNAPPAGNVQGVNIRPTGSANPRPGGGIGTAAVNKAPQPILDPSKIRPLPGAAEIAAKNKQQHSSPIDEPPKPETMSSAPAEKGQSINAAKEITKHHPSEDHLSAPASAIPSGTASPQPEPEAPAAAAAQSSEEMRRTSSTTSSEKRHRGSEVIEAPVDEIKRIESESALKEEDEDGEETKATEDLSNVKLSGGEDVAEQEAKKAEDAAKSVED